MPSWKYILNYESMSITTDDLVDATYDAAVGLNRLKGRSGGISGELMAANQERIIRARKVMAEIDNIMKIKDKTSREEKLKDLKEKTYKYSLSTVCEKKELEFPLFSRQQSFSTSSLRAPQGRSNLYLTIFRHII